MKICVFTCFICFILFIRFIRQTFPQTEFVNIRPVTIMNPLTLVYGLLISIVRSVRFSRVLFSDTRPAVRTALNGTRQGSLPRTVCVLIAMCFSVSLFLSDANAQATVPAKPNQPTVDEIRGSDPPSLQVSWDAPNDGGSPIDGYNVRYRKKGVESYEGFPYLFPATILNIPMLAFGTSYEVQVRARNGVGDSEWSDPGEGKTVLGRPTRPVAPMVTVLGPSRLRVNWDAPHNGGFAITGSTIRYREKDSDDDYMSKDIHDFSTVSTLLHLKPVTTYEVQVRARNSVGDSDWSASTTATTNNVPDAPAVPTVIPLSTTSLRVTWMAPNDNGATIIGYDIQYRVGSTGGYTEVNPTGTSTSLTLMGLNPGTTYEVQVRAVNSAGNSQWSASGMGTTDSITAGQPERPTVTPISKTELGVTWTAPTVTGADITGYDVQHRVDTPSDWSPSDPNNINRVFTTSHTLMNLDPGTTYQVRVRAVWMQSGETIETGETPWSLPGTETTFDVPGPPKLLVVSGVSGEPMHLQISWTAPTNTGGTPLTGYDLEYHGGSIANYTAPADYTGGTSHTLTGLQLGTTYQVQVRAKNSVGDSNWVQGSGMTGVINPPGRPARPTVSAGPDIMTSLRVTWIAPADGGSPITDYDIRYRVTPSGPWSEPVINVDVSVTSHTLTVLNPSTSYEVQVRARNMIGDGPWSESGVRRTGDDSPIIDPPPPPPPGVRPLTVTFADYPEERPTDTFQLTIRFSQPVTGFRPDDITIETELKTGRGNPTVESLTPTGPARTYTATIQLPPRTTGTLKLIVRARAARSTTSEATGPATATASEPIDFGRRRVYLYPSPVAMDTIVFNEFRNAPDDKNDWVELKNISDEPVPLKEWEVSMVVPHAISSVASNAERAARDREVVEFPDYTLPPGGILLLVNTDPRENDLIHGQNIADPHHNPALRPHYLIAPELILPDTPYLLILRSARDKNGAWDGFEDLLGNYHKGDVSYRTQIWPLRDTWVYTGTGADLLAAEVYERVRIERVTSLSFKARLVPEKRGYLRGAWTPSEVSSGLGYRPGVSLDTALGTPGYATPTHQSPSEIGTGDISISEVMFATNDRGTPAQWIELYNASATEIVNLEDYRLRIELRDHQPVHRHITFPLRSIEIMPRQTVLLVSRKDRASENIPARQIYDVQRQNRKGLLLRAEGFSVRLLSPDGTLVDMVGNLDGKVGRDTPRWALPSGFTETGKRSSMIRRYEDGIPWQGTVPSGWVRAAETSLLGPYTYYGLPTDNGTPGYRQGSPLPVTLSSFRADLRDGSVVLNWTTASEMENAGFHVLRRRDQASDFVEINPTLILGAGTTAEAQTYTYRDTTAQANVPYHYRLEEVSLSGERRAIATVRMRGHLSAVGKLLWKWADVKKSD